MLSINLFLPLAFLVLLTQLILSRFSDSLLSLCDSAHTLSLLLVLCPPLIVSKSHFLTPYAYIRLPILFALLSPLLLCSLSFSLAVGSLGRFVRSHHPHQPVLIFAAGVLGLGFNALYIAVIGAWKEMGFGQNELQNRRWLSSLRLFAFVTPSSLLLTSSFFLYITDKDSPALHYMDPIFCLVSIAILVTSVYSSLIQNARILLQAVPHGSDLLTLRKDLDTLCGSGGHHELHVWALAPGHVVASLHIHCSGPEAYHVFIGQAESLFKQHGIRDLTVQPEFGPPAPCILSCTQTCTQHLCCYSQVSEPINC